MNERNKNNPFKIPENYFEGFNNRLMDRLSEQGSNIPKQDGFLVPENYFESLHGNIFKKMEAGETKIIRLNTYKKYYYAAASVAALILVVFTLSRKTSNVPSFESLANSEIDAYFENNDFGLSMYEIGEVIPLDNLEISDILENQIADEHVLNYLNDNTESFEPLNLEDDE